MTTQEQLKLLQARLEKTIEELEAIYDQLNEVFSSEYTALCDSAEDPDDEEFLDSIAAWDKVFSIEDNPPAEVLDAIDAVLESE